MQYAKEGKLLCIFVMWKIKARRNFFTYLIYIIFPLLCKESIYCFFFQHCNHIYRKRKQSTRCYANSTFQKQFMLFMVSKQVNLKKIQTIHGNLIKFSQHSCFSSMLKSRLHQTEYVQSPFVALTSFSSFPKPWISPSSL